MIALTDHHRKLQPELNRGQQMKTFFSISIPETALTFALTLSVTLFEDQADGSRKFNPSLFALRSTGGDIRLIGYRLFGAPIRWGRL